MAGLTTSAGAVDIYSINPEAEPLLKSSSLMSTYDSGVSITAVEPSDLDEYLTSSGSYLTNKGTITGGAYSPTSTVADLIRNGFSGLHYNVVDITNTLLSLLRGSGTILDSIGGTTNGTNVTIWQLITNGFRGLAYILKSIDGSLDNLKDYSTILQNIYSSVDGLETGLSTVNTSVGTVNSSVNTGFVNLRDYLDGEISVSEGMSYLTASGSIGSIGVGFNSFDVMRYGFQGLSSFFRVSEGSSYLNANGQPSSIGVGFNCFDVLRYGFLGLRQFFVDILMLSPGNYFLSSDGVLTSSSGSQSPIQVLRQGFMGISKNIRGSASDNIYTSTLNDNNNTSTTVNSTGLGPLLNTQLSNIGENLGHLAYIFASDDDVKLKEDSQPLVDTTDSFYDDSDSNVKISTNNVGSLKDIAGNFTSIIDADADIGDAFAVVSNSNTYRWFSADTAMNLDSLGVATVDFEESTYDRLHREFNEIYFPDRVGGGN